MNRLWREQTSALGPRNALEEAVSFARSGDSLVVTKICRLARSVADLVAIIDRLEKKGVSLRILSMGIDTATPTGRLMLNLLASIWGAARLSETSGCGKLNRNRRYRDDSR